MATPVAPSESETRRLYEDAVGDLPASYPEVDQAVWAAAGPAEPIAVLTVARVATPDELFKSAWHDGFCYVPVEVGGRVVAMFTVQYLEGEWIIADTGGDATLRIAAAMDQVHRELDGAPIDFLVVRHERHGLLVVGSTGESVAGVFLYPPDMTSGPTWLKPSSPLDGQVYLDDELMRYLR